MFVLRSFLLFVWVLGDRIEGSVGFLVATPLLSRTMAIATPLPRCNNSNDNNDNSNNNDDIDIDDDIDNSNNDDGPLSPDEMMASTTTTTTLRIDDGGSNLTDRFKHKVHALMGDYDPTEGAADDEDQDGNIMKAFVTFPTKHVFDVVGRVGENHNDNDNDNNDKDNHHQRYADEVKTVVFETTGDDDIECEIVPRGTKFVKVRCTSMVESTTMINTIYDELGKMESTVMKF